MLCSNVQQPSFLVHFSICRRLVAINPMAHDTCELGPTTAVCVAIHERTVANSSCGHVSPLNSHFGNTNQSSGPTVHC